MHNISINSAIVLTLQWQTRHTDACSSALSTLFPKRLRMSVLPVDLQLVTYMTVQDQVCWGRQCGLHAGLVHRSCGAHHAALHYRGFPASAAHLQSSRLLHVSAHSHSTNARHMVTYSHGPLLCMINL